jgi:predicted membrane channel-forming protein YqfA (hemolysin III family)
MEPTSDRSLRHPATYCWPPILAVVPLIVGYILGATRPEVFRYTHGYFEIAIMIGFFAAIGYTFRLWKYRADRGLRVPLYLNMGFIILTLAGGFLTTFA